MHGSTEKALDAHDLVDATRQRAGELLQVGADVLSTSIDRGATTLGAAVERLPIVQIAVEPAPRTHRLRRTLLVIAIVLAGVAAVGWLRRRMAESPAPEGAGTAPEPPASRLHVVPADGGGWDVTDDADGSAASHHGTQAEGIAQASATLAEGAGGEVVIHALDGHPRDTRRIASTGPD
jgi:hypothetical protein